MSNDLQKYLQASTEIANDITKIKKPSGRKKLGGFDIFLLAYTGLYIYWRLKNA